MKMNKQTKASYRGNCAVSWCITSTHRYSQCSLQQVIVLDQGTAVLAPHKDSSQIPCCRLCHRNPATLDLQVWPLHILQQFTDAVDVGVHPLRTLGLGGSWLVKLSAFLQPHQRGQLCCAAQVRHRAHTALLLSVGPNHLTKQFTKTPSLQLSIFSIGS